MNVLLEDMPRRLQRSFQSLDDAPELRVLWGILAKHLK